MSVLNSLKACIGHKIKVLASNTYYTGTLLKVLSDGIALDIEDYIVGGSYGRGSRSNKSDIRGEVVIAARCIESAGPVANLPEFVNQITNEEPAANTTVQAMLKLAKKRFAGQQVAVLCNRYQYRGILEDVTSDGLVLQNATCVEVSGACCMEKPNVEDPIGGDLLVMGPMIEIIYQPKWCFAPLPKK